MSARFQCDKLPDNYYNSLILLENAYYVSPSQERIAEIFKMYQIAIEFYSENNNDAKSERLKAKIRFLLCSSQTMNTIYKPRIMRKYESKEKLRDKCEMIIKQMHISPYDHGNIFNKNPTRNRRLLMHKREIMRLFGAVKQEGLALIPLSLYFKGSLVKVQLGLCKGKKLHDKRETAAKRDAARTIDRALKEQNR